MARDLYVAGSAVGGKAGWAWVLVDERGEVARGSGPEQDSSYRAGLRAVVEGLRAGPVTAVHVADQTLLKAATEWLPGWKAKKFKKVKHADLVRELAGLLNDRTVVRLDDGEPGMRSAKKLAKDAAKKPRREPEPAQAAPSACRLVAYTDGGCRGNPGVGGWGFLLVDTDSGTALSKRGGETPTTNNRMEITAALEALTALNRPNLDVEIRTDSKYLKDLATKWIEGWKRKGWRKRDGEPVKNLDLVQRVDELNRLHTVTWTWVPGHAGEPGNEHADMLTNHAMDDLKAGRDPSFERRYPVSPVRVLRLDESYGF